MILLNRQHKHVYSLTFIDIIKWSFSPDALAIHALCYGPSLQWVFFPAPFQDHPDNIKKNNKSQISAELWKVRHNRFKAKARKARKSTRG